MKLKPPYLVPSRTSIRLSRIPTASTGDFVSEQAAAPVLLKHIAALDKLQEVFYASGKKALLVILQGMDCSGKDGAVRNIFTGINPQGCDVTSFKVPTPLEARHDFLWRVHNAVPAHGMIGIFNRSHYEDVLSPLIHKRITEKVFRQRLKDINEFEHTLADNGVVLLKFFLHISREEQAIRLKSRLEDPEKQWKLDPVDFYERKFWKQYSETYEQILAATSRKHAPWFVIPSDHKWYRNVTISSILVDTLQRLDLKYPKPPVSPSKLKF
ncbi:MAG: polyphosphate:nucleotide phosphotransferase, family [Acidobacteriaceae bacterium]|nr:polyphosphate:nucleotide phosphotransferase, family [Acidobacteriaceae bacterium]